MQIVYIRSFWLVQNAKSLLQAVHCKATEIGNFSGCRFGGMRMQTWSGNGPQYRRQTTSISRKYSDHAVGTPLCRQVEEKECKILRLPAQPVVKSSNKSKEEFLSETETVLIWNDFYKKGINFPF
jgi:hypothetical protein